MFKRLAGARPARPSCVPVAAAKRAGAAGSPPRIRPRFAVSRSRAAALPPAGSVRSSIQIAPCFEAQGNVALVDFQTYLYYIQLKSSEPSQGVWVPYNDDDRDRRFARTSSGSGPPTSSTTSRSSRPAGLSPFSQRRGRQAGRLQHGGAPARQERRLHRLEESSSASKIDDKLKEDQRVDSPRHLHRSRARFARSKASSAT